MLVLPITLPVTANIGNQGLTLFDMAYDISLTAFPVSIYIPGLLIPVLSFVLVYRPLSSGTAFIDSQSGSGMTLSSFMETTICTSICSVACGVRRRAVVPRRAHRHTSRLDVYG
jgi:hypothetical protein